MSFEVVPPMREDRKSDRERKPNADRLLARAAVAVVVAVLVAVPIAVPATANEGAETTDWPPIDDAQIRPGVQINGGECTSNFIFRDLVSNDLLIGLAGHCVDEVGQAHDIQGVDGDVVAVGTVAYTSFDHADHDFGLLRIPTSATDLVHPAALHFGGPTAMADSTESAAGDKFVFYGNSMLRPGIEPSNWHEGYVTITDEFSTEEFTSYGHAVTPGIVGDSGSGLMDAQGRALGVLITVGIAISINGGTDPFGWTGTNGFTNLDAAVASAEDHTGMQLELQTWQVLDPGLLPE